MSRTGTIKILLYAFGAAVIGIGAGAGMYAFPQITTGAKTLASFITHADKKGTLPEAGQLTATVAAETTPPGPTYIQPFSDTRSALIASKTAFIEINFSKMQIYSHAADGTIMTTPIKTAGDPQGWGGTPAGLYTVLDKSTLALSAAAGAYMPYALHFYGKYYVHGEPYYPGGEKLNSDVSGGCVQIHDEDIQALFKSVPVGTPVLVVDRDYDMFAYPKNTTLPVPDISAQSYLVADLDSGEVLADKNSNDIHSIASITKLMTAIVVAENTDLRKETTATPTGLEAYGETPGLVAGGSYRLVELLYPLLIPSSNDAAETLTGFLGRTRTIRMMNEKAKDLFMTSTAYVDPSGLDPSDQSSAHDLYLLGRYLFNNRKPVLDITRGKRVTSWGPIGFSFTEDDNKNQFADDPDFLGGKTGYIIASRYTGLFLFKTTVTGMPRRIAIVVLGSESLKDDAQALKDWVAKNYQ